MTRTAILSNSHIHTPGFIKRLKERKDISIASVYDANPDLARKYALELDVPVADSPDILLADKALQAVVITGTTGEHDHLALPVIKAKKHLFIEKPLATTGRMAEKIAHAVRESGIIFQTGHFLRSSAIYRFLKQEIDADNFGTITRARHSNCHSGALGGWFDKDYRWFFDPGEAGGGGFFDLGCHSVDILVYFFGPVESATGALAGKQIKYTTVDEYGEALVKFSGGITGSIAAGWVDVANPVFLEIAGTEGHATIFQDKLYYQSSKSTIPGADGKQPIDTSHFPQELSHAFDLFFDVIQEKLPKSVLNPIDDALNVAKTMEAIYLGHRIGAWVKV